MKRLLSAIDWIVIWTGKVFSVLTLVVAFVVVYEIVMRYVFHAPTLWASESMVFGCALVYVMGGAWTALDGKHVRIELLYGRMPERGRAVADLATFFFFALYLGMMLWASCRFAWESFRLRETAGSPWDPPVYPFKIALAIGILLLLVQGTGKFIRDLHFAIRGRRL